MKIFRSSLVLLASIPAFALAQTSPAEIPAAKFAQLPILNDAALSPDGTHIAYLRPIKGRDYLIIQELGSSERPAAIPPTDFADFSWVHWASDERLVFVLEFTSKRGRVASGETRLVSVDRSGQDIQYIVRPGTRSVPGRQTTKAEGNALPEPQLQHQVVHWLPDDPENILVAIDEDFDGGYAIRRIEVANGRYRDITPERAAVQNWIVDHTGTARVGYGYGNEDFRMDIKVNDQWIDAQKTAWWEAKFWPEVFTTDPGVMVMSGPNETGREVMRTVHLADATFVDTLFEHEVYDAEYVVLDADSGEPIGIGYTDDVFRVDYFDDTYKSMHRSLSAVFPNESVQIVSTSADYRQVLVLTSGPTDPGVWHLWNRDAKQLSTIGEKMPGLPPEMLSAPQAVSYTARDGSEIPAYLTVPLGAEPKNLPTIILPHGGPRARSSADFWFLTQYLVSRGYAVLEPNFRGSSGYGHRFANAGRKQWGGLMQDDVTDGTQWLIDEGIADPERVCIVGWSYGGYAAAMGTIKTPDLYQCAVSINGVLNLQKIIADDHNYIGGRVWTRHMGLDGEKARSVSPFHQADKIGAPLLIIQSEDDARINLEHATEMAEELDDLDKEYELVTVELGGHSMQNDAARLAILESTDRFLQRHIGAGR